ncbi:enhanced intracellular survival protein Eis [Phascolarctobacterium sp.]|uniref:GNAT family N-acetyltransferase n=1 Tax=Phascolarctobacterium sp. TaxID=2049039 RepID=UPI002A8347A0|nr:GNAT family N-acetyltransferase [Phascolarctobacterium sp.]MDY5045492.1 GNAT family N-acetyltransferase [Phascolarctobacterium sp.]
MIYRVVNAERMPQVEELWDYCFEKRQEPFFQYYFNEYVGKNNMVIGGFEKVGPADEEGKQREKLREKLRTMVHVNPYMLRIREQEQLAPYLVGVATAPEARGQHAFGPLLETTFEVLRSEGFTFATLMPIYAGIYLPYEFAYCYYGLQYKMPLADLGRELAKAAGKDLAVERVALDKELLAPLYAKLTSKHNGVPLRTDFQWKKLLTVHGLEGMQCALVYRNGEACGYMFYYISEGCFTVHELLTDGADARNRLLQYAAMHQSSAKEFAWLAPAWDKTYLGFADQSLSPQLRPFMMARCLDARKALAQVVVPEGVQAGSVVLLLTDKVIDRNNHLLKLEVGAEGLSVKSTIDVEEVTMDMGAFTQLYFGAFSATELFEAGRLRVKVGAEEKLALLDSLFPKQRNFINEYF